VKASGAVSVNGIVSPLAFGTTRAHHPLLSSGDRRDVNRPGKTRQAMSGSKRAVTTRAVVAALIGGAAVAAGLVVATALSAGVAYVLGLGLTTFLTYSYDKLQSKRGGRRVPEPALLVLSLIGGALGGWAGMLIWRHKTRHARFWIAQVVGTVAIAAVAYSTL
jgi:uncharacterized membrane protein YsdA (DUF1294 family)